MEWDDKAIAKLKQLWADPANSGAQIGRLMNISKNAVVGKVHRLNLPPRPSPIKRGDPAVTAQPQARVRTPKSPALAAGAMLNVETPPAYMAPERPKPTGPVIKCCFPIGDPQRPSFHFCGTATVPGKPYCPEHCKIAYVSVKNWEKYNRHEIARLSGKETRLLDHAEVPDGRL